MKKIIILIILILSSCKSDRVIVKVNVDKNIKSQ